MEWERYLFLCLCKNIWALYMSKGKGNPYGKCPALWRKPTSSCIWIRSPLEAMVTSSILTNGFFIFLKWSRRIRLKIILLSHITICLWFISFKVSRAGTWCLHSGMAINGQRPSTRRQVCTWKGHWAQCLRCSSC